MALWESVRRALGDRRGTIAPIFGFSVLVIFGAVGMSVDGARLYSAKQRLQTVADAAVLAAARTATTGAPSSQVVDAYNRYITAADVSLKMPVVASEPDLSTPRKVRANLVATVPMVLLPVLGVSTVDVHASASVEYGFTKLEVALALDNTGSMAGAKLDALKTSANGFIDQLLDKALNDGDIRVALVPFAQYVNVGLANRSAPWISVPADYTESLSWCRDEAPVIASTNCRTVTYSYTNDGVPMTGSYETCDYTYGPSTYICTPYTATHTWNGCVGSRNFPRNMQDSGYATPIPGLLDTSCPAPIQPLTSVRADLHTAVNAMAANGETYLPAGVMWGWRALSAGEPYAESGGDGTDASGNRISKVLILMTDGENTKSPSYPSHDGSDADLANTLTQQSCDAVKAANVRIFSIAFNVTTPTVKSLLATCASNSSNFYDAGDAAQLDAAMQAIGAQIGELRLTN